jgi:hypothetical protein
MIGGPGLRFALEAAFLIALAVVAGLAELSPTAIVLVMGAAWLLVAAIEWLAWREAPRFVRVPREEAPPALEPVAAPDEPAAPRRRFWRRRPAEAPEPEAVAAPGEDTQDLAPPAPAPPAEQPAEQPAPVSADERAGT